MALDLTDYSSNSNTLTNSGASEITSNLPFTNATNAALFTHSESDYMQASDDNSLDITGDLTIEAWIKLTTIPSAGTDTVYQVIAKAAQFNPTNSSYLFYLTATAINFNIVKNVSQVGKAVTWSPSTGTWYHIAVAYDASAGSGTFYLNGSQQGSTQTGYPTSIDTSTSPLQIGGYPEASENYSNMQMKEVRIWNDVRTGTEISNNKDDFLANPTGEANLVAYYPFENPVTSSPSSSPSASPSSSVSASPSLSPSASQSPSSSISASPSSSPSASPSPSSSPSASPSSSPSSSQSPSSSVSASPSSSVSASPSLSPSLSGSPSPSSSPSASPSPSSSPSASPSATPSSSPSSSVSLSPSASPSATPSSSPSLSPSVSESASESSSPSLSSSPSSSPSATPSASPSLSPSASESASQSPSSSASLSPSASISASPSPASYIDKYSTVGNDWIDKYTNWS